MLSDFNQPQLQNDSSDTEDSLPKGSRVNEGHFPVTEQLKLTLRQLFLSEQKTVDVIRATPGIGKTYIAEQIAVESDKRVVFAFPTNKRAREEAKAMQDRFDYAPTVILGRNQGNCDYSDEVNKIGKLGLNISQNVCRTCSSNKGCGYFKQFRNLSRIILMPYESLVEHCIPKQNDRGEAIKADVLIFDENPQRAVLQQHELKYESFMKVFLLGQPENYGDMTRLLMYILCQIAPRPSQFQPEADVSSEHPYLGEMLQDVFNKPIVSRDVFLSQLKSAANEIEGMYSAVNEADGDVDRLDFLLPLWFADVSRELGRIHQEFLARPEPMNSQIQLTTNEIVFYKQRQIETDAKIIVLDAYARSRQYSDLFQSDVQIHEFHQPPNWGVQLIRFNTSKSKLNRWENAQLEAFFTKISDVNEFQKMVVFTHKSFVARVEETIEQLNLGRQITVDYFYKGRGSNSYESYDAAMVLGSAEPNPNDLLAKCRALHWNQPYLDAARSPDNQRNFENEILQEYKQSVQFDEIIQVAHRIRPAISTQQKKLILVMNFLIPDLVTEVDFQQIPPEQYTLRNIQLQQKAKDRAKRICKLLKPHIEDLGFFTPSLEKFLQNLHRNGDKLTPYIKILVRRPLIPSSKLYLQVYLGEGITYPTMLKDLKKAAELLSIERHDSIGVQIQGKTYRVIVYGNKQKFISYFKNLDDALNKFKMLSG